MNEGIAKFIIACGAMAILFLWVWWGFDYLSSKPGEGPTNLVLGGLIGIPSLMIGLVTGIYIGKNTKD